MSIKESLLLEKESNIQNSQKKSKTKTIKNSRNSFEIFSSALFISQYQSLEESSSENSSKNHSTVQSMSDYSNEKDSNLDCITDLSPSLEKCIMNELLDTISNDPPDEKKVNINYNSEIKKNLFIEKSENEKDFNFDDSINGFEYQLKYIENSFQNIMLKSYKKNRNSNKNGNIYKTNSNYIINSSLNKNTNKFITPFHYVGSQNFGEKDTKKESKLQLVNNMEDWNCMICGKINHGYRAICSFCKISKNIK